MAPASCPSNQLPARRARASGPSGGQSIVEYALVFPVFLFLLVIAIDAGRLYFSLIQVHNAAREGAAADEDLDGGVAPRAGTWPDGGPVHPAGMRR